MSRLAIPLPPYPGFLAWCTDSIAGIGPIPTCSQSKRKRSVNRAERKQRLTLRRVNVFLNNVNPLEVLRHLRHLYLAPRAACEDTGMVLRGNAALRRSITIGPSLFYPTEEVWGGNRQPDLRDGGLAPTLRGTVGLYTCMGRPPRVDAVQFGQLQQDFQLNTTSWVRKRDIDGRVTAVPTDADQADASHLHETSTECNESLLRSHRHVGRRIEPPRAGGRDKYF